MGNMTRTAAGRLFSIRGDATPRHPLLIPSQSIVKEMGGRLLSPQARRPLPATPTPGIREFTAQTLVDGRGQLDRDGENERDSARAIGAMRGHSALLA